jgi:hypothetical protein
MWRIRHDGVQKLLADELTTRFPNANITINKKFRHAESDSGGELRPDIIIDMPVERKVFILDMKCPIDAPSAWFQCDTLTANKYKNIVEYYKANDYTDPILSNFIVSALGSIPPRNMQLLNKLGFSKESSKFLIDRARRHVIHWSRNIWVSHIGSQITKY